MAKDDMEVVIYKILRYLYECMKQAKVASFEDMFNVAGLAGMPQRYYGQVIEEMMRQGFVAGFQVTKTKSGTIVHLDSDARVTLEGATFLAENSRMKKAAEFAGKAFEALLMNVLAAALPVR